MLIINKEKKEIHMTRGDDVIIDIEPDDGYIFRTNDVVRFKVFEAKKPTNVVLHKDVKVAVETPTVPVPLDKSITKIGDYIEKPVKYWYEVELNPDTKPQTIIGYDLKGPKLFVLYPEGGDMTTMLTNDDSNELEDYDDDVYIYTGGEI